MIYLKIKMMIKKYIRKQKIVFFNVLFFITFFSFGQIPKGHFIDADDSSNKGFKLKPFIQKDKGIYHYAILTNLPFENRCEKGSSEKEQIECSEEVLNIMIKKNIDKRIDYLGSVYVYLTITKRAEIADIKIKSYPQSNEINKLILDAVKKIKVRPGEYKGKKVVSRLWTSLIFE